MNKLITIKEKDGKQLVDARELHEYLENKRHFSDWIKQRIEQYSFIDGEDFVSLSQNCDIDFTGFQRIDYALSIEMSKELCMVENNAKGRQARKYFIEVEKRYKSQPVKELTIYDYAQALLQGKAENEKLQLEVLELKPKANIYDEFLRSGINKSKKELGEIVGLSSQRINQELCQLKWQRQIKKWNPKKQTNEIKYVLYIKSQNKGYMWRELGYEYQDGRFADELTISPLGILKFLDEMIEKGIKKPSDKERIINQLFRELQKIAS